MYIQTADGLKRIGGPVVWPKAPEAVIRTTMAWVQARNYSVAEFNAALAKAHSAKRALDVQPAAMLEIPNYCKRS